MDNKYTPEDLRAMQAWPLELKIQVTQTRIAEWINRWKTAGGGHTYLSLAAKTQLYFLTWHDALIRKYQRYLLILGLNGPKSENLLWHNLT